MSGAALSGAAPGAVANPLRGEVEIVVAGVARLLRPSFAALVAAEGELGSLFRFVERVADGDAKLAEIAGLLWHCLVDRDAVSREQLGEAVVELGLAAITPILKALVTQILKGQ